MDNQPAAALAAEEPELFEPALPAEAPPAAEVLAGALDPEPLGAGDLASGFDADAPPDSLDPDDAAAAPDASEFAAAGELAVDPLRLSVR